MLVCSRLRVSYSRPNATGGDLTFKTDASPRPSATAQMRAVETRGPYPAALASHLPLSLSDTIPLTVENEIPIEFEKQKQELIAIPTALPAWCSGTHVTHAVKAEMARSASSSLALANSPAFSLASSVHPRLKGARARRAARPEMGCRRFASRRRPRR